MAGLAPVTRRALIVRLHELGFEGPYTGGKHEFMVKGQLRLTVPNPHQGEIGRDLLIRILR
jgi:predicted RNA binding protein YcfA (HicA-like mRNA interferase family)